MDAQEDAWAGGANIYNQEEHQLKMGTKEKVVKGLEYLKITESNLDRKAIRAFIKNIISEATVDYGNSDRRAVDSGALDKLTNIMVIGTLATHGVEIDQGSEGGKEVMAEFDDIIRAALASYPECASRLASHVRDFVEEADYKSFMQSQSIPDMGRDEILDIVVDLFRKSSPGELSRQEFDQVMGELPDEYDFISAPDLAKMNITYDEVLNRVGDIENVGMPTDRP